VSETDIVSEPMTGTVVCELDRIDREGGVAALVGGQAVAVFRTWDDQVFALSNFDPFSKASVLARGIVGTKSVTVDGVEQEVPCVASPMYKEHFDLQTGRCIDDDSVSVPTYPARVTAEGMVVVDADPS
jgi:nitrite reductase (NADH) small subunit